MKYLSEMAEAVEILRELKRVDIKKNNRNNRVVSGLT